MYEYRAKVIKCYDADTITVELDLGFRIKLTENIRLARIDAPEIRGDERPGGLIARDVLREQILDKEVIIKTEKDKKGKYGRYIGEVILDDTNINDWLVTEGFAIYKEY